MIPLIPFLLGVGAVTTWLTTIGEATTEEEAEAIREVIETPEYKESADWRASWWVREFVVPAGMDGCQPLLQGATLSTEATYLIEECWEPSDLGELVGCRDTITKLQGQLLQEAGQPSEEDTAFLNHLDTLRDMLGNRIDYLESGDEISDQL